MCFHVCFNVCLTAPGASWRNIVGFLFAETKLLSRALGPIMFSSCEGDYGWLWAKTETSALNERTRSEMVPIGPVRVVDCMREREDGRDRPGCSL